MKTILILDDEQAVRNSLIDYFEDQLWKTISAESAEEALTLLDEEGLSAAVVDVRLPDMDGNEFIRQALKINASMAFVICTGSPEYAVPVDLLAAPGVSNRLFKKPIVSLGELESVILQLINKIENKEGEDA